MYGFEANADSGHDVLWRGLPHSNFYRQMKLTGSTTLELTGETELERRACRLDVDRHAALGAFINASGLHFTTIMLGIYHVVLQWYLGDVESIIGCCLLENGTPQGAEGGIPIVRLRPSYVYAEDDDRIEDVLRDIEERRAGHPVEVDIDTCSSWTSKRAPTFYYVGIEGRGLSHSDTVNIAASHLPFRVIVGAATEVNGTELSISIPSAISHAIPMQDFHRRHDTALSSLLAGNCSLVGELKAQLGDAAEVPYHQIEEMQQRVITLWATVLGIPKEKVDATSNYYELGGTSLNAFRLVNRVRLELKRDLSIWDIVENPTVEQLSLALLRD